MAIHLEQTCQQLNLPYLVEHDVVFYYYCTCCATIYISSIQFHTVRNIEFKHETRKYETEAGPHTCLSCARVRVYIYMCMCFSYIQLECGLNDNN